MNYSSRIKQVEKQADKDMEDGTVVINVKHCFDTNRDIEPEYAVFRARRVLGIRPKAGEVEHIIVPGAKIRDKYRDMTPDQAKEILKGNFK